MADELLRLLGFQPVREQLLVRGEQILFRRSERRQLSVRKCSLGIYSCQTEAKGAQRFSDRNLVFAGCGVFIAQPLVSRAYQSTLRVTYITIANTTNSAIAPMSSA